MIPNQPPGSFYGHDLPATVEGIDPKFLNSDVTTGATNDDTHRLLMYFDLATKANAGAPPFPEFVLIYIAYKGQESAINDFANVCSISKDVEVTLRHTFAYLRRPRASGLDGYLSSPSHIDYSACRSRGQD